MEHSPYSKAPLALVLVDLTDMEDPVGLADLGASNAKPPNRRLV